MALSVKVDLSAYPEGIPVGIVGLGVVENGGTLEVAPEQEEVFFTINGGTIEDVMAEQEEMQVTGNAEFTPPEPEEETEPEVPTVTPPESTTTPPIEIIETTTTGSGLPPGTGGDA